MDKRSNAANHSLCHFSYADGRRCRMLRHRDHPGLCPFHSREERQRLESERIGTELAASLTGNYLTASDINHVLGKVFTALAQDRISVKKAKALAYLARFRVPLDPHAPGQADDEEMGTPIQRAQRQARGQYTWPTRWQPDGCTGTTSDGYNATSTTRMV